MEIWHTDTEKLPEATVEALLEQLPKGMTQLVNSYRNREQRKARIVGRLMIRDYFIENRYENNWCDWEKNQFGKPYVLNGPFFNISYSDNIVVAAFDKNGEIGVDVERMKETNIREISGFFHSDEISLLSQCGYEIQLFYTIWTRKEALLKASGKGITPGLDRVSVLRDIVDLNKRWYLRNVTISEDYRCAVCCLDEAAELLVRSYGMSH